MAPGRRGTATMEPRELLTAVVLADSFTQRLRPVTVERPKALLPLANTPLLDYTLEWLATNAVDEVFVFCCAHAAAVQEHLDRAGWSRGRGFPRLQVVVGANCLSLGDALRALDQRGTISGDFVLVSGDVVSNTDLSAALAAHSARRRADRANVMTLLLRAGVTRRDAARLGGEPLVAALDPTDGRLLKLDPASDELRRRLRGDAAGAAGGGAGEDGDGPGSGLGGGDGGDGRAPSRAAPQPVGSLGSSAPKSPAFSRAGGLVGPAAGGRAALPAHSAGGTRLPQVDPSSLPPPLTLDASLFRGRGKISIRSDLLDVGIAICAPEVLLLFSDNFDYQDLRGDFVAGVLSEEELGNRVHLHLLHGGEYAARVENLRSYAAVSKDVLARNTYPLVPDVARAPRSALGLAPLPPTPGFEPPASALADSAAAAAARAARGVRFAPPAAPGASSARAAAPAPTRDDVRYGRGDTYVDASARVARDARVGPGSLVGAGSSVGAGAEVSGSVVGRNCFIGPRARVVDSYLLDGARVLADAVVESSLLCDGVVVRERALVRRGSVLSFRVVVGEGASVPPGARVSLARQRRHRGDPEDDDVEAPDAAHAAPGLGGLPPGSVGSSIAGTGSLSARAARRAAARGRRAGSFGASSDAGSDGGGGGSPLVGSFATEDEGEYDAEVPREVLLRAAGALASGGIPEKQLGFHSHAVGDAGAGFAWRHPSDYDPDRHALTAPRVTQGARRGPRAHRGAAAADLASSLAAAGFGRPADVGGRVPSPLGAHPYGPGSASAPGPTSTQGFNPSAAGAAAPPAFPFASNFTQTAGFAAGGAPAPAAAAGGEPTVAQVGPRLADLRLAGGHDLPGVPHGLPEAGDRASRGPGSPLSSSSGGSEDSWLDGDDDAYFGDGLEGLLRGTARGALGSRHGSGAQLVGGSPGGAGLLGGLHSPRGGGAGSALGSPRVLAGGGRAGALAAGQGGALGTATNLAFKREVAETLLRCVAEGISHDNVVIELNGLKIAEDKTFADCARYMLTTVVGLALAAPRDASREYRGLYPSPGPDTSTKEGLTAALRTAVRNLATWQPLLARFSGQEDDQVELLLTLEEYCASEGDFIYDGGSSLAPAFARLLQALYEADIVSEPALLQWEAEKAQADDADRVFVEKAKPFLDWLREADEEDSSDSDDGGSDSDE